jgi:hypothetical protein
VYARTRTLTIVARENVYIRRGLRVVGFDIKAMREPQVVELARASFTLLFLYVYVTKSFCRECLKRYIKIINLKIKKST